MANKNTPAHDFAPAWLKIPSYDTFRPSGADGERGGHTSRRDEHSFNFVRHPRDTDPLAPRHQYFTDTRRERDALSGERKPSYLPSYHQSLDFDDSHYPVNTAHNFNSENSFNGPSANSQPALLRRPHSRHDFRNIPASYTKVEKIARYITNNGGYYGNKTKGKIHDSCVNSNNSIVDGRGMGVTSNNFNQEFPSLQGDISEEPTTPPPALNGGVWEKPRNMKIHSGGIGKKIQLIKKPVKVDTTTESCRKSPSASPSGGNVTSSPSGTSSNSNPHTVIVTPVAKGGSAIYRALVPAKSTLSKKSSREGMKLAPKEPIVNGMGFGKSCSVTSSQTLVGGKPNASFLSFLCQKSSTTPPPSAHSMEILVKHPKAPGNKSEFLKALRNENKGLDEDEGKEENEKNVVSESKDEVSLKDCEEEEPHINGIDIAKLTVSSESEKPVLSSSLEAEQRLLREMGWKEECSDDDNYAPLTEDELREFRDLTEKIAQKNGIRRNLHVNWSPRRLAPFTTVAPPADNWSSSSESDSDF